MTEIIIIEASFLIRSALKKLILEIDDHYRLHELTAVTEIENISLSSDYAVIIINHNLLPDNHQMYFSEMNLPKYRIVVLCCKPASDCHADRVILLNDDLASILKKLQSVLKPKKHQPDKSHNSKILSDRETDILRCVALGMTNKEIADKFFLSIHTVIAHRKNISAKLDIKTIAGFTMYALLNNIISPGDGDIS
jgi:DNA-binding CsgD family transcriptional regulator